MSYVPVHARTDVNAGIVGDNAPVAVGDVETFAMLDACANGGAEGQFAIAMSHTLSGVKRPAGWRHHHGPA